MCKTSASKLYPETDTKMTFLDYKVYRPQFKAKIRSIHALLHGHRELHDRPLTQPFVMCASRVGENASKVNQLTGPKRPLLAVRMDS